MTRPSMAAVCLDAADLIAQRSTCRRLKVGAVITTEDMTQIVSWGYNGNYRGGPNDCDSDAPGNCGCLHAEDNALLKAPFHEGRLLMFCTHSPCVMCAKRIVNSKVTCVFFRTRYRSEAGLAVLDQGGVNWIDCTVFPP